MKKLYKGNFNYSGATFELYTHSLTPERAFLNFMTQLAKRLQVGKRTVMFKFNGDVDNFKIEEIQDGD